MMAVREITVELARDLEILLCVSRDLAQRIPECHPLVEVLESLHGEWYETAEEIPTTMRPRWLLEMLGQSRFVTLKERVSDLVDVLSKERDTNLVLVESAVLRDEGTVWRQNFNRACTRSLVSNFYLTYCRAESLQIALAEIPASDLEETGFNLHVDVRLAGDIVDGTELRPVDDFVLSEVGARPGKQALRLVEIVLRVLPPDQRSRYGEEFRAELYGLAEMNRPYGAQLIYVLRLFNRVFDLRYELRRPSRRSVNP